MSSATVTLAPSRGAGRERPVGTPRLIHSGSAHAPAVAAHGDRAAVELRSALAACLAGDVTRQVREEIVDSWRRSRRCGLQPDDVAVPFDTEAHGESRIACAGRAVLDQLALDLTGTPVAVVLADANGRVVDRRVSDLRLGAHLDGIRLAAGFLHAEHLVGTNAIGTALVRREPMAVDGAEHFADVLTSIASAGAPITDPRCGRIVGVIVLTSMVGIGTALMLPLAARAAREIEQRVIDEAGVYERVVFQQFLQGRRWAKGPLVYVIDRTIMANAAADRLIDADDTCQLRECAARLASDEPAEATRMVLSSGTEVMVRGEPLLDGASRIGALLRLEPIAEASVRHSRTSDGHPAFGWDSLTDTERSVIELVAQGLTNRQAAEQLFLSHHTVGFHLRSIFIKLGVTSRVQLTRLVLEHDRRPWPTTEPEASCSGAHLMLA